MGTATGPRGTPALLACNSSAHTPQGIHFSVLRAKRLARTDQAGAQRDFVARAAGPVVVDGSG